MSTPAPRMRLRSARLPDVIDPDGNIVSSPSFKPDPDPPRVRLNRSASPSPRNLLSYAELSTRPTKSSLSASPSSHDQGSSPSSVRRRRGKLAGERVSGSGSESDGAKMRSSIRKAKRATAGGKNVRFARGGWERLDVLVAVLCVLSFLLLALFIYRLTREPPALAPPYIAYPIEVYPSPPSHLVVVSQGEDATPSFPPPSPGIDASSVPSSHPAPPPTPVEPEPIPEPEKPRQLTMEERVQQVADELGVTAEDFVRSLRTLGEMDELN